MTKKSVRNDNLKEKVYRTQICNCNRQNNNLQKKLFGMAISKRIVKNNNSQNNCPEQQVAIFAKSSKKCKNTIRTTYLQNSCLQQQNAKKS